MLGLFGTAFGLSLQAKALAGGGAKPLNCTACGVLAAALVAPESVFLGVQNGGFLRFPKRSNTHLYNALADHEPNKA